MKNVIYPLVLILLFSCNTGADKTAPQATPEKNSGEELFKANCANCHKPDKDFTGPSLKGARSRWPEKALLYDFVRNPASVIANNKYAKDLQSKYGSVMTPSQLSNDEIDAILNYCDTYTP